MSDPEASQEQAVDEIALLQDGAEFSQGILARRPGLNGIALWLRADPAESREAATIEVGLFGSRDPGTPLESFSLTLKQIQASYPVQLSFRPLSGPGAQTYTLRVRSNGLRARLFGRAADVYPYGDLWLDGIPLNADLAFRLTYDYSLQAVLTDLRRTIEAVPLAIPLALVLFLPGWLALSSIIPRRLDQDGSAPGLLNNHSRVVGEFKIRREALLLAGYFDPAERAILSVGLSLSLIPVLLTWSTWAGFQWNRLSLFIFAGLLAGLAFYRLLKSIRLRLAGRVVSWDGGDYLRITPTSRLALLRLRGIDRANLALVGVLSLTFFVRLAMVRDLAGPPWVDSVHHATITRRILEEGAFPQTYAPYIEIETSSYHAGYHSALAAFVALSGLPIDAAMLIFGQVLNTLVVLGVYSFTMTLIGDRRAGIIAVLIAGLFTPMPAFYTSWGRYTQLAGLMIFPAVLALFKLLLDLYELPPGKEANRQRWKIILAAALAGAGLFLTHYRVAAFLACLIAVYLPLRWLGYFKDQGALKRIFYDIAALGGAALLGVALTLPWWPGMISSLFLPKVSQWSGGETAFSGVNWGLLTPVMGRQALILAGAGLVFGLLRLRRFPGVLILWVGLLFALANLGPLGLLGSGFVNSTSVEITLFIPVAASAGYFLSRLLGAWQRALPLRFHLMNRWFWAGVALILSLAAARLQLPLLRESTFLLRNADQPAIAWIREHLSSSDTVLVNPFLWGYGLYAGDDGGYWISPLAGSKMMPPPALYGLANDPDSTQRVNDTIESVLEKKNDPAALSELLRGEGIQYVFIGARGGSLSPQILSESADFATVYEGDGVWIFQVRP